ncbi:MAG: hypothetical protein AB1414_11525 [bacterium]
MKLKEKIYHAMTMMKSDELWLLYEQIQLIQHLKQIARPQKNRMTIDDILTMTSSSHECWSETVKEDRMERI